MIFIQNLRKRRIRKLRWFENRRGKCLRLQRSLIWWFNCWLKI